MRHTLERRGAQVLGWRTVPVDPGVLGTAARRTCPRIEQVLVRRPPAMAPEAFERLLYIARKEAESCLAAAGSGDAYVASLSARTVVYKGLLTAVNLSQFFLDLMDPRFESALALFHQRYSTNTFPSWRLAQPMRFLAHNGEINTVQGHALVQAIGRLPPAQTGSVANGSAVFALARLPAVMVPGAR